MRTKTILATVSVLALVAGAAYYSGLGGDIGIPPTMNREGVTVEEGLIIKEEKVDYEAIVKTVLAKKASFLTLTVTREVIRDQSLITSIKYSPFPSSRARVRVKYRAEYPIGYVLSPGKFTVSRRGDVLVITTYRPQLIVQPSVRLLSYKIIEKGFLIDEKTAVIELQQKIQPEAVKRARRVLRRKDVIPRSERALRGFLTPILRESAGGQKPPTIEFRYR